MSPELEAAIAALLEAIRAEVQRAIAEETAKLEPRLWTEKTEAAGDGH